MRKLCFLFLFSFILGFAGMPEAEALPRNFRNVDTFFIGAMPDEEDVEEMYVLGITTFVSLHKVPPEVAKRIKKLGMKIHSFPLRTRLLRIEEIMDVIRNSPRNSVYVHCLHGADRAGAVTAYWLSSERQIAPFHALASVISPKEFHIKGLRQLAREYGICLYEPRDWLGKYSGAKNGGLEGLKICGGEWYTRLARNYLMMTLGDPLTTNERFWDKYNKRRP